MTITLESIKEDQRKLAAKIAAFEAQANERIHLPEAMIELNPGEHWAGIIVGKDGEPSYHLVLLPAEEAEINWADAVDWAAKHGGEYIAALPTRREQALLYANLKDQFQDTWYWSCEQHDSSSACAWRQGFTNGYHDSLHKLTKLRARAVRRVEVKHDK